MKHQLLFEIHAYECNWHQSLLLLWEEDGVTLRCTNESFEVPETNCGFPVPATYEGWHKTTLSKREVTRLEKLLHLTHLPLAVPNLCLLDGADCFLSIQAGGQIVRLHWQDHDGPWSWSPLDKLVKFFESLYLRHAKL